MDQGTAVGVEAQKSFPGGVLAKEITRSSLRRKRPVTIAHIDGGYRPRVESMS